MKSGFTLLEVLLALAIIVIAFLPLMGQQEQASLNVIRSREMYRAASIAEAAINNLYINGYEAFEAESYLEGTEKFNVTAEFSAEEVNLDAIIPQPELDELTDIPLEELKPEEEEANIIVVYHIRVNVQSREFEDIAVSLSLDIPEGTADLKGVELLEPIPVEADNVL